MLRKASSCPNNACSSVPNLSRPASRRFQQHTTPTSSTPRSTVAYMHRHAALNPDLNCHWDKMGWDICVSYSNFVSYSTINDYEISFALDNPKGRSSRCQHDARARCQRQRAPDYFIRSPALRGYVYLLNPILHHARPSPPPHHGSNLQPLCSAFASPSIHPCISNKRYGRPHCQ